MLLTFNTACAIIYIMSIELAENNLVEGRRYILGANGEQVENHKMKRLRQDTGEWGYARRAHSDFYLDEKLARLRNILLGSYLCALSSLANKLPPLTPKHRGDS